MAIWMSYHISNQGVDLVVDVDWRTTQAAPIIHHDVWRYNLTDPAVVGKGASALAERIVNTVKARARVIDNGVQVYTGVQASIGVPQDTVVQIL
jgi:hypothetical protein